jgi:Tol biopolymer transport system component
MKANGSDQTRLTESADVDESWPQWSPDGTKLIFCYWYHPSPLAIFLMNSDGTDQHLLFTGSYDSFDYPQWLPDGKEIVFSCRKAEKWNLYTVMMSGAETNLTNDSGDSHLYFIR